MPIDFVKVSQIEATGFATENDSFLGVREGHTLFIKWSDLNPSDLLLFSSPSGGTKCTTYSALQAVFSGAEPPLISQDRTDFKISGLERTAVLSGRDSFIVSVDNLQFSEGLTGYASLPESKVRRITYSNVLALLSPIVISRDLLLSDFFSDVEALADGTVPCGHYRLSQTNAYEAISPGGKGVYKSTPDECPSYKDVAEAITAGVKIGEDFTLSKDNTYGIPSGDDRFVLVRTDGGSIAEFKGPFKNDLEAKNGGVWLGERYLAAQNNDYGYPSPDGQALLVRTI